MPAGARKELFTALELGKTLATSDSKTTTFVPWANRRAYLPRTPFEKSYSSRMGGSADLLLAFFIRFAFSFAGAARADHADTITSFRVDANRQFSLVRAAEDDKPPLNL